ncbi:uncharacterized protein LOC127800821 isoform X1 [Diospyros lotus]|uniref:uncharacterized protein LOC127800821 isoform X1 n=1 Tax=Diospyros lotus TaxID=55363 RepID=UPI0022592F98|nr:uncharacterized protein LOC127800821 isoform X1 [Diospyros lotus]
MAVNSCEEDAYYILVVPDEGTADPNCESQLRHAEVPNPLDCQMCLKAELNSQNCINVDRDIDVGNSLMPKTNDGDANLMTEGPLTKAFQRQISLQIGEKFMQLLMNDSSVLPKFTCKDNSAADRVHEAPNNRTRKYKRSASFNSRKVALLFSVLSIMGTVVLIYLTLRVRQIGVHD